MTLLGLDDEKRPPTSSLPQRKRVLRILSCMGQAVKGVCPLAVLAEP
jgi:hypothetical protein